ncbi:MAG: addiction module protein [Candidatus Omnitrophica bacterium]|nr:addiction module protein [Candidatus Omnitrophota bacterium]
MNASEERASLATLVEQACLAPGYFTKDNVFVSYIKRYLVMDKHISVADLLELSVSERIQFAEDIWDSIAAVSEAVHIIECLSGFACQQKNAGKR